MSYLLDTCILIDLLRLRGAAQAWVGRSEKTPSVCAVSLLELFAGARSQREEARIEALIDCFHLVSIEPDLFRSAGSILRHYQSSHGLDMADALIAATAEHHNLPLATLNVKHFPMFRKLKPAY